MLRYAELKTNPRKFLSLTSLTPDEFEDLLPAFEQAYLKKFPASKTLAGKMRQRKVGAGREGSLDSVPPKLLFALVYQKDYPLQSILGELFSMGQGQANEWIHRLLPILKQALDDLGVLPERDPKKFKRKEKNQKDAAHSIIDGTERRRQRPKQPEKQALHYSGKKKIHSDKNVVIAAAKTKRVSYLSQPYPGKMHDKKVADTEDILAHVQTMCKVYNTCMIFPIRDLMDEQASRQWLMRHLHPKGLRCPHCQADLKRARTFRISQRTQVPDYRCRQCGTVYNLYTGTVFARKQLRPRQVILLLRGVCKGEPSTTISQELGVTWRTVHEVRRRLHQNAYGMLPETPLRDANTETDEMFQNAGEKGRKAQEVEGSAATTRQ